MKKRILSLVIAMMMLLSLFPCVYAASVIDSGTCGENLTWTLDDSGTLTISGTGATVDWKLLKDVPWSKYSGSVSNVVISEGVTGIGSLAFWYFSKITNITFPSTIVYVEDIFDSCSSLVSVSFPKGLETISNDIFLNCSNFTDIYYEGSEEQWQNVKVQLFGGAVPIKECGVLHSRIKNANMHYNSTMSDVIVVEQPIEEQQQVSFTMPSTLMVSLSDLPSTLFARGQSNVVFTTDNENVISLHPTNERSIFDVAAVSGVYVKGLTPGTATIIATAPDGTSLQCAVTVEGKIAETISDELVMKAKICANNAEYQYMRDSYKDPSTVLAEGANIWASKQYQNINDFIDFFNLDYTPTNYYEIVLMDMLQNDNAYYESVKKIIDNDFLREVLDFGNEQIHSNLNANKVTVLGLNTFDVDKFYTDLSFLDAFFAGKNVSESMYKKFEQIYALSLVTSEQIKTLNIIKKTTLNENLKAACDSVIKAQSEAAQQTANEIAINTTFAGIEELGQFVGQRGWNLIINLVPGVAEAKLIVASGKIVSNNLYNADKLSTDLLTMAVTAEIMESVKAEMKNAENVFLKDMTPENAGHFMAMADFYKALCLYGCDTALEFKKDLEYANNAQSALDIAVKIFPSMVLKTFNDINDFFVKKCDSNTLEEFEKTVSSIKSIIESYNFYNPYGTDIANYIRSVVSTTPSEWAKPYIDKAIGYNLLDEDYRNNYQNNITRAEFCTLLTYLIGEKSEYTFEELAANAGRPAITVQFDDTIYVYVSEIAKLGIINGTGNNMFEPLGEITRQQAAKMLCETAKVLGHDVFAPESDLSGVSDWAKEGVNFVVDRGIMNGTDKGFEPDGKYTKEQAITTMVRFYENLR